MWWKILHIVKSTVFFYNDEKISKSVKCVDIRQVITRSQSACFSGHVVFHIENDARLFCRLLPGSVLHWQLYSSESRDTDAELSIRAHDIGSLRHGRLQQRGWMHRRRALVPAPTMLRSPSLQGLRRRPRTASPQSVRQ